MTPREERGAATVLVVAVAGLLLVIGLAVVGASDLVVSHRGAQSAADLAAAGAAAAGDDACGVAGEIARANDASLTSCAVLGDDVVVGVSRKTTPGFGLSFVLSARARAGPG